MPQTALTRFLRYVVIDTQSDPLVRAQPSTEKQKDLGRVLVAGTAGDRPVRRPYGRAWQYLCDDPANTDKDVPVICFCSHMDTAPDFTGTNVKPQWSRTIRAATFSWSAIRSQVIRVATSRN